MHFNTYTWEYLINFMEILFFYLFIHTKLRVSTRFRNQYHIQMLFLALQFIILCVLNHFDISSMITISLSCLIDILFALIFYKDAIVMQIFWGSMYSVICMISEYITVFVPHTFSNVASLELLLGGKLRIPFTLLYLALIAVFVFLFHCMMNKNIQLSPLHKFSYLVISIAGILIGHYIMLVTLESEERFHETSFTFSLVLINLFFITLFLSLLLYIYQLGYSKVVNTKLMEKQKLLELEELEYQNLIKATESLREMKHDIDIHLDVIQSFAANKSTSDLLTYIDSYHHSLEHTHHLISTGNNAIDCILSSKIDEATKLGIKPVFSVIVPQAFPLDALSLSSLLGNLWNNALEACQRLKASSPENDLNIQFYIKPFQHMVLIHIENNYDGIIKVNSDHSYSSVKEGTTHGIGLKRIYDIVENAEGIIQINTDNNIFTVHIMIPLEELQNENVDNNS